MSIKDKGDVYIGLNAEFEMIEVKTHDMFISKEILAVMITALIATEGWMILQINDLNKNQAMMSTSLSAVNRAVNDVSLNQPTIRELVVRIEERQTNLISKVERMESNN